jgi:hypothetical protein
MSRLVAYGLAAAVIIACMPPAAAGDPFHRHDRVVLPWDGARLEYEVHPRLRHGNGVLPYSQLHGPHGVRPIPFIDERAHRPSGLSTVNFPRPTIQGVRLDWCAASHHGCGAYTAQVFCATKGFRRAVQAVQERGTGHYAATVQIESGHLCHGPRCTGFQRIVCTRE